MTTRPPSSILGACIWTLFLLSTSASAQTIPLDSLWPNGDGLSWIYAGHFEENVQGATSTSDFTASLTFDGTNTVGGMTVQNLVGRIDGAPVFGVGRRPAGLDPLSARLWIARPELRDAIARRAARTAAVWPFVLLGPAQGNIGFLETATTIGTWREEIAATSWLYLVEPKGLGPNFTLQLVPDLADDVFLQGNVTAVDVSVRGTDGGLYPHCWIVEYLVDLGQSTQTDELGQPLGTFRMHTSGSVVFGAGVGPILMEEQTTVVEIDCPTCPFGLGDVVAQGSLGLNGLPVAAESSTWSELKTRY